MLHRIMRCGLRPFARCQSAHWRYSASLGQFSPRRSHSSWQPSRNGGVLAGRENMFLTTPIFYVNGDPHLGHLYTLVLADGLKRFFEVSGSNVFLATGTDEHGSKVAAAAHAAGLSCSEYCDRQSLKFQHLCEDMGIAHDRFIRTTESVHARAVQALWSRLAGSSLIQLGDHEGWYSHVDEAFLPAKEVDETQQVQRDTGHPVSWVSEPNYKFRIAEVAAAVTRWLDGPPSPVLPQHRAAEVRGMVDELGDSLSVSRLRSAVQWGIPVPGDADHTVYVWLDALCNYLTVAGYPEKDGGIPEWPVDLHVIGKDIAKFHCVYWPGFLAGAGLPIPRRVAVHGHWMVDGVKMSKSLGNVLSPGDILEWLPAEYLRFFLLSQAALHQDSSFSDRAAADVCTAALANTVGNLVARCFAPKIVGSDDLVEIRCPAPSAVDNRVWEARAALLEHLDRAVAEYVAITEEKCDLTGAMRLAMEVFREANAFFTEQEPWKKEKGGSDMAAILHASLRAVHLGSIMLWPALPKSCGRLLSLLELQWTQEGPWEVGVCAGGREVSRLSGAREWVPSIAHAYEGTHDQIAYRLQPQALKLFPRVTLPA